MRRLLSLTLLAGSLIVTSAITDARAEHTRFAVRAATTTTTTTTPEKAPSTTEASTTTTLPPTTTSTTTTTTTVALPDGRCSEWFPLAVEVGWPVDRLQKLGQIMWAESRCLPDVSNCCSYGLVQMEWSAHRGWMSTEFSITNKEDLFNPTLNLLTALWLAEYAEEHYGCWSQPWYMSGDWC
jgi:hypothetical protein